MGVFCSSLSNEYRIAATHFDLSREDLIDLSLQASQRIFGPPGEVQRLATMLQQFRDTSNFHES